MAWDDVQTESDEISHTEWNQMISDIKAEWISGSYAGHSGNASVHLQATTNASIGSLSSQAISGGSLKLGATTVTTILDEDAMGSDSATALATQQSIKKYVDDNAGGGGGGGAQYYPADYIIYHSGGTYKAMNGRTGVIESTDANDADVVIQHAIDDLSGGGIIQLLSGTYTLNDQIDLDDNIWLRGAGIPATTIITNTKAGPPGTEIRCDDKSYIRLSDFYVSGYWGIDFRYTSDGGNLKFENIKVHTCSSNQGVYTSGFNFRADNCVIEKVTFRDCEAWECNHHGYVLWGTKRTLGLRNAIWDNCRAIRCGLNLGATNYSTGWNISEDPDLENVLFLNCYASGNLESGFHNENDVKCTNVRYDHCIAEYNGNFKKAHPEIWDPADDTFQAGFAIAPNSFLHGCHAIGNSLHGIRFISGMTISDCVIDGKGITPSGLYVAGGHSHCIITNNIIRDLSTGFGMRLYRQSSSIITNNQLINIGGIGIRNWDESSKIAYGFNVISNNYFKNVSDRGIYSYSYSSSIKDNFFKDITDDAIEIHSRGNRSLIMNNIFENVSGELVDNNASNCIISSNINLTL